MIQTLKALVVVMVLALLIFRLARPVCLRFIDASDFDRRRNVWLALTAFAFLSPSFWLYVAVAVPTLLLATKADRNPAALFLLVLYAVPQVTLPIPVTGINYLLDLNHQRLMSFVILLPVAFRPMPKGAGRVQGGVDGLYLSLLAYMALVDTLIVFHVFRRLGTDRKMVADALVMLGLSCAVMGTVGVFENLKGWLLYANIGNVWGSPNIGSWLMRGSFLRGQAGAGHSLNLGFLMAMGFGVSLLLQTRLNTKLQRWGIVACMWAGLLAAMSRGPWLAAALVLLTFVAFKPQGISGLFKAVSVCAVVAALVLVSPIGDDVVAYLPFVGTVDSHNVQYRQALFETSVTIIKQNLLFGNPFALLQMEHLRQGEGIIDLMNGYVVVALFYGLVGLVLFLILPLLALTRAVKAWRAAKRSGDHDLLHLGACLIAMMTGTLLFIATAGFGVVFYALAGLLASFATLSPLRVTVPRAMPAHAGRRHGWAAR
jgi:hypothetical protein